MRPDIVDALIKKALDGFAAGCAEHQASAGELLSASLTLSRTLIQSVVAAHPASRTLIRVSLGALYEACQEPTTTVH